MTNQPKLFDDTNQLPIFSGTAPRAPEPNGNRPPASVYCPGCGLSFYPATRKGDTCPRCGASIAPEDVLTSRPPAEPMTPTCPYYGREVPDDFEHCDHCPVALARACYAAWERAQMEPTKEELFEKALSFGEIPEITLRDKSTGWLRAYIEVYLNEQWRVNGKKSRKLARPKWRGI